MRGPYQWSVAVMRRQTTKKTLARRMPPSHQPSAAKTATKPPNRRYAFATLRAASIEN